MMNASRRQHERGSAMVAVLICFVLIVLICGAILKLGIVQRGQLKAEEVALQAEWLVESGLERAAAKLAGTPGYEGETWRISRQEMNGPAPGLVTITVDRPNGDAGKRRVTVMADYPSDSEGRSRQHKTVTVDLGAAKGGVSR
jgi:hypothetical protein